MKWEDRFDDLLENIENKYPLNPSMNINKLKKIIKSK